MRTLPRSQMLCAAAVLIGVGLVGCGGSSGSSSTASHTTTSSTAAVSGQAKPSHLASLTVTSTAGKRFGVVDPHYTCRGANVSPPIEWTGLSPEATASTKEILVFVRTISHGPIITNWALAGIKPNVTKIEEGKAPPGAIVGRNSSGQLGYSLCPPEHATVAFITIGVYALPRAIKPKPGFDPETVRPKLEHSEVSWGGITMLAENYNAREEPKKAQ